MEGGVYVKNILFDKKGHINKDTLHSLKYNLLNDDELIHVLAHIGTCEKCADAFANSFTDNELLEAPLGFSEEINLKLKLKESKNLQFMFYCTKVIAAASVALIMVFSNGLDTAANINVRENNIKPINLNVLNNINEKLSSFSQYILKMEVFR